MSLKVNVSSLDFSDHLFIGILVGISYFTMQNNVLIVTEVVQFMHDIEPLGFLVARMALVFLIKL